MTVTLYTGHVGSGKSYEVVKSVILPALIAGRSVVSNIDGLDVEAILEYCGSRATAGVGALVVVDRMDVRKADFFPVRQGDGSYISSPWVELGALVVIDECPFYWGTDKSILPAHLAFFREHRHIVDADGVACDLVVVSQTVDAVHRSLKGLVEFSIDCRKLSALGLNRKYTTITYESSKRSARYIMGRSTQTYDKAIFPLYRSFASSAGGKILQTDKRFTIWSSKMFWLMVLAAPVVIFGAGFRLYHSFFPAARAGVETPIGTPGAFVASQGSVSGGVGSVTGAAHAVAAAAIRPLPAENAGPVSVWKVAGSARFAGQPWAVLRRPGFPLRYMPLSACVLSFGVPVSCRVGTEVFEPESAPVPSAGPAPDLVAKAISK